MEAMGLRQVVCCSSSGSATHLDSFRLKNAGVGPKVTRNKIQRGPGRYHKDLCESTEGRSHCVPHSNGGCFRVVFALLHGAVWLIRERQ